MSTDCFIRCLDCDESSGTLNHHTDVLAAVIKAQPQIIALMQTALAGDIELRLDPWYVDGEQPTQFVAEHPGHRLVVMDEYGHEYDETGKRID